MWFLLGLCRAQVPHVKPTWVCNGPSGPRCPTLSPLGFILGHLGPDAPRFAHLGFYWDIWMTQTALSNWDSTGLSGPHMHNRGPYVTCLSASFPFEFETCLSWWYLVCFRKKDRLMRYVSYYKLKLFTHVIV